MRNALFSMDGTSLLKLARNKMKTFINQFFEDLDYTLDDVDIIIPHQTSKIGNILLKKILNCEDEKVMVNLENHGNCIAASIPILLHQSIENKKIKRGDLCLLIGTSAGFSIAASLFKF